MIVLKVLIKRIAYKVLLFASPIIVIVGGLQFFVSIKANDEIIRNQVRTFFNEKIGKAVKFDTIFVRFDGCAFFSNFSMSKTLDFNDNLNLLKCSDLKVHLSFFDLLKGRITIQGVEANNAVIAFSKQSGEDYSQFINSILYGSNDKDHIFLKDHQNFKILIKNSSMTYYETFINDTMNVAVEDFNVTCEVNKRVLTFEMEGRVLKRNDDRKNGSFRIAGYVKDSGTSSSGNISLAGTSLDMGYLNYYIQDIFSSSYSISGYCNASGNFTFSGNSMSGSSEIKVIDAEMRDKNSDSKYPAVLKSSFIFKAAGDIICGSKYRLRSCEFYDGDISFKSSGMYDAETGLVSGNYTLDECDLSTISSNYLSMVPVMMSGFADSFGSFNFNAASGIVDENDVSLKFRKAAVKGRDALLWFGKTEGEGAILINNSFVESSINGKNDGSNYKIQIESILKKIAPFSTDSKISLSAEKVSAEIIYKISRRNIDNAIESALSDKRTGYEEVKFLATSAGAFLNNNDLAVVCDFSKIGIGGNAFLNQLKGNYTLKKGVLKGKFESAPSYGGIFAHDVDAFFNTDYPRLTSNASLQDFDLSLWSKDAGISGIDSGILSSSYAYNMNGSRASHLIENGTLDYKISIKKTDVKNNIFESKIAAYCLRNGFPNFPDEITGGTLTVDYHQAGENGGFRQFSFQSDVLRMDSYIKNVIGEGIKGQGSFTVTKKDTPFFSIPYRLGGTLRDPLLIIDVKGKKAEELKLF
jgi:hypothetical protein